MATETWLCVRSILHCMCTATVQVVVDKNQGKIMYIEIAKVPWRTPSYLGINSILPVLFM
jgi:hypothetical protein